MLSSPLRAWHAGAQDYLVKPQLSPIWLERSLRYGIESFQAGCALQAAEQKYHSVFRPPDRRNFSNNCRWPLPSWPNMALARIYGYSSPEELMTDLVDIGRTLYVQPNRRQEFIAEMQRRDELSGVRIPGIPQRRAARSGFRRIVVLCAMPQARLFFMKALWRTSPPGRKAEENLRNSEALYHSLVTNLPQNILRKDLEGRFTFANQQFCSTLGHPLHEIIGKTDYDFFPPELAKKYQIDDQTVLSTGKAYGHGRRETSHRATRRSMYRWVKTPLYGADGKPIGLQGIFWDITAQKLADEKIRRANSQLALSRKQLREKNREMEDDLKMAKEIQLAMLPQQYPIFPVALLAARSARFNLTTNTCPLGTVGGDFFHGVSAIGNRGLRVRMRCGGPWDKVSPGHGDDPGVGRGAEARGIGSGEVPGETER